MKPLLSTLFYTFAVRAYESRYYGWANRLNEISHHFYASVRNYSLWGLIEFKLNNIEKSRELLTMSLEMEENVDGYQGLCLLSLEEKNYKNVIKYAEKALTLNPEIHELKVNLILGYVALKQYDDAESIALDVFDQLSGELKLLVNKFLAEIYLQKGEANDLKKYVDKLDDNKTTQVIGQVYLIEYYLLTSNLKEAERSLKSLKRKINKEKFIELKKKIELLSSKNSPFELNI